MHRIFACLFRFRWCHQLSWPVRNVQTCVDCGQRFPARVQFGRVEISTADLPRLEPQIIIDRRTLERAE